jgi:hypothetical protein
MTVLPILGARPIRPSVGPSQVGQGEAASPAPAPQAPAAVRARWDGPDALPSVVTDLPFVAHEPAIPVQRSATPESFPTATPTASREITFPLPDGASALPSVGVGAGGGSPSATPTPSPSSSTPGSGAGQGSMTLARPVAPATPAAPAQPAPSSGAQPVVARIVADASPSAPPTLQTSPAAGSTPVATFTATPNVQRVDGVAAATDAAGEAAGGEQSDAELDDLARKLFGRFKAHLRTEVVQEREAKGLGFDAF